MNPARVMIVDDHPLVAQGIAVGLERRGIAAMVVDELTPTAVIATARCSLPDLIVLDFQFDGQDMTALDLIAPLTELGARVIVVSGVSDPVTLGRCVEAGALDVVNKQHDIREIIDTIAGRASDPASVRTTRCDDLLDSLRSHRSTEQRRRQVIDQLTERELEVLGEIMQGASVEEIAQGSFVSVHTVRSHVRSLLQKFGVRSQVAAIAAARRAGFDPLVPTHDAIGADLRRSADNRVGHPRSSSEMPQRSRIASSSSSSMFGESVVPAPNT